MATTSSVEANTAILTDGKGQAKTGLTHAGTEPPNKIPDATGKSLMLHAAHDLAAWVCYNPKGPAMRNTARRAPVSVLQASLLLEVMLATRRRQRLRPKTAHPICRTSVKQYAAQDQMCE